MTARAALRTMGTSRGTTGATTRARRRGERGIGGGEGEQQRWLSGTHRSRCLGARVSGLDRGGPLKLVRPICQVARRRRRARRRRCRTRRAQHPWPFAARSTRALPRMSPLSIAQPLMASPSRRILQKPATLEAPRRRLHGRAGPSHVCNIFILPSATSEAHAAHIAIMRR